MFRLVIADDEALIRARLVKTVNWQAIGFEICGEAANGLELLRLVRELLPDVILTDIRMPVMDGLECVRQLRAEGLEEIKVVVLSGYAEFEYARSMMRYGVADYILKPIEKERLYQVFTAIYGECQEEKRLRTEMAAKSVLDTIQGKALPEAAVQRLRQRRRGGCFRFVLFFADEYRLWPEPPPNLSTLLDADEEHGFTSILYRAEGSLFACLYLPEGSAEAHRSRLIGNWNRLKSLGAADVPAREISVFLSAETADLEELPHAAEAFRCGVMEARHYLVPGGLYEAPPPPSVTIDIGAAFRLFEERIRKALTGDDLPLLTGTLKEIEEKLGGARLPFSEVCNHFFLAMNRLYSHLQEQGLVTPPAKEAFQRFVDALDKLEFLNTVVRCAGDALQQTMTALHAGEVGDISICLRRAVSFVDTHFRETISLEDVARHVGLSSAYLSHMLSSRMALSYTSMLRDRRLSEAERLLRESELRIYEVGGAVGIPNARHFSALFRERTGLSPNEYRHKFAHAGLSGGDGR